MRVSFSRNTQLCQFVYWGMGGEPPIISNFNIRPMALHGKNGIIIYKASIWAPPIIFRNWPPGNTCANVMHQLNETQWKLQHMYCVYFTRQKWSPPPSSLPTQPVSSEAFLPTPWSAPPEHTAPESHQRVENDDALWRSSLETRWYRGRGIPHAESWRQNDNEMSFAILGSTRERETMWLAICFDHCRSVFLIDEKYMGRFVEISICCFLMTNRFYEKWFILPNAELFWRLLKVLLNDEL